MRCSCRHPDSDRALLAEDSRIDPGKQSRWVTAEASSSEVTRFERYVRLINGHESEYAAVPHSTTILTCQLRDFLRQANELRVQLV